METPIPDFVTLRYLMGLYCDWYVEQCIHRHTLSVFKIEYLAVMNVYIITCVYKTIMSESPEIETLDYLVIYHQGCCDGYAAGIVAYDVLHTGTTTYRILPVNVSKMSTEIPRLPPARNVLSFDLSYTPETLRQLVEKYRDGVVEVYDHHITTRECLECEYAVCVHFDNEVSGAMLAWRHYHPDSAPPRFIQYVQDRDLWHWRLEHSSEINAYLQSTMLTRGLRDWIGHLRDDSWIEDAIMRGGVILATVKSAVDLICKGSRPRVVDGLHVAVVNSPIYGSEIGDHLSRYYDYVVVWRTAELSRVDVSLRSEKGKTDVSQIAKRFGGGGHVSASGFATSFDEFRDVYLQ